MEQLEQKTLNNRSSFDDWYNFQLERTNQYKLFDKSLYMLLYGYWRNVNFHDRTAFIVIDGRERMGKSTLAAKIGYTLDLNFNIDKMALSFNDFVALYEQFGKGDALVYDEAVTGLFSRDSMQKINSMLVKTFMISAAKNMFQIFCAPNWWLLDKYLRDHAVDGLFHVNERASYWYFEHYRAKSLSVKGSKFMSHVAEKPTFRGGFTKDWPCHLDKGAYDKKKAEHIQKTINELGIYVNDTKPVFDKTEYMTTNEVIDSGIINRGRLQYLYDTGRVKSVKVGLQRYVHKDEFKKLVEKRVVYYQKRNPPKEETKSSES